MSEIKWVFLDVGSTLVDESDVYESRCSYVISEKGLERDEFMEKASGGKSKSYTDKTGGTGLRSHFAGMGQ